MAMREALQRRFAKLSPRAQQWLWFIGLYLAGLVSLAVFAYGLRWLIKG